MEKMYGRLTSGEKVRPHSTFSHRSKLAFHTFSIFYFTHVRKKSNSGNPSSCLERDFFGEGSSDQPNFLRKIAQYVGKIILNTLTIEYTRFEQTFLTSFDDVINIKLSGRRYSLLKK